ncbi:hypothetical protein [Streptomyces sp. NBC_00035]|uniref:hypothetical protein n=1 Tax=Streptomyces sp. NBC_00035 TaxID=2903614 RepID=UPI00325341AA
MGALDVRALEILPGGHGRPGALPQLQCVEQLITVGAGGVSPGTGFTSAGTAEIALKPR